MAKAPAFQWYPKDCDTDEDVRAMDDREFGFYMRCLNHSWLNGGLPKDLAEIARIMGRTENYVRKVWERVGKKFSANGERLVNPKQEEQRGVVRDFVESRRFAANKRWDDERLKSKADAHALQVECSPYKEKEIAEAVVVEISLAPKNKDPSPEPYDPFPGWQRFKAEYPPHRLNEYMDLRLWMSIVESSETESLVLRKLAQFKRSADWTGSGGKFVPKASKFLGERIFNTNAGVDAWPEAKSNGFVDSVERVIGQSFEETGKPW